MGVYRVKGSPYLHFAFTVKGCRYRGSTGLTKKSDARQYENNERRKIILGETDLPILSLVEAFDRYEEKHAMFLSSYPSIKGHVDHMLAYFGNDTPLHEIGDAKGQDYVTRCRTTPYRDKVYSPKQGKMIEVGDPKLASNATINRRLSTLQTMHSMASKTWKVKTQPIDFEALRLKERKIPRNPLDKADPQALFDAAPTHLQHFIVISLYTGWRKMNVLSLNGKEQINLERRIIWTYGKGDKYTETLITDGFHNYITLNGLHEMEAPCAYKGRQVRDIKTAWKTLFKNTGIKYRRRHDLRHTFCTWIYEKTGDALLVKESANHADIKTSLGYTHAHQETQRDKLNQALDFEVKQIKIATALPK